MDFLLVIIELFSPGVTAESLLANIDWKSPFLMAVCQFGLHIRLMIT